MSLRLPGTKGKRKTTSCLDSFQERASTGALDIINADVSTVCGTTVTSRNLNHGAGGEHRSLCPSLLNDSLVQVMAQFQSQTTRGQTHGRQEKGVALEIESFLSPKYRLMGVTRDTEVSAQLHTELNSPPRGTRCRAMGGGPCGCRWPRPSHGSQTTPLGS